MIRRLICGLCLLLVAWGLAPAQNRQSVPRLSVTTEFRPPVTTDCTALTRQREGDMCIDTDDDLLRVYDGSTWITIWEFGGAATNGVAFWGDSSDSFDTGTEVCAQHGMTCADVFALTGGLSDSTCAADQGTASTYFLALCY